jgi:hypothetical protein
MSAREQQEIAQDVDYWPVMKFSASEQFEASVSCS